MDIVLLVARLLLASVFVVAGTGKLVDLSGSRQAMRSFGVPAALAGPLGVTLPLAELAIAVALIPRSAAWWGALVAMGLLVLFVAAIGYNLAKGRTPDCHCFGQLHSAPAGWPTLARNGLLAAVAALILVAGFDDPGASAVAWLNDLSSAERAGVAAIVVVTVSIVIMGWFLTNLLLQNGRLLVRLDALEEALATGGSISTRPPSGLPSGTPAPAFQLTGLHGETMTLNSLRAAGTAVMLVFTDPNCGPCTALMPEIGRWQREYAGLMTVALIGRGSLAANRSKSSEHGLVRVLLQEDREVALAYAAVATPSAVLIRSDGTVESTARGSLEIQALVTRITGSEVPAVPMPLPMPAGPTNVPPPQTRTLLQIGEPAPQVDLPNLDGMPITLDDFSGQSTLVLFWNPGCGFCQRMLNELRAWRSAPPAGAPELLIVSTGTVDANRAMELGDSVVLDQDFSTGRAFGAQGTPAAVMVDAQGRVASGVVVGAPAIMALARIEHTITSEGSPVHGDAMPGR